VVLRVRTPDVLALRGLTRRKQSHVTKMLSDWTRGVALVGLVVLAWAFLVPGGIFWTAGLALGVIGAALATAVLVHRRRIPTLAQVISSAQAEPAMAPARADSGEAGLRPREGR
jgi:hypothetical protein